MSVQPGPVSPSSIKHIFVDYENVPHFESGLLKKDTVILTLLLGRDQAKQHAALVKKLKENGTVHLIRLASSGKNAVDFALAYYLGREAVNKPSSSFHIVSKDTGYDPLIKHLNSLNIRVHRHKSFSSLSSHGSGKVPPARPVSDLERALKHLRTMPNRPTRKKTLINDLRDFLGKTYSVPKMETLIKQLIDGEHIHIDEKEKVTYPSFPVRKKSSPVCKPPPAQ